MLLPYYFSNSLSLQLLLLQKLLFIARLPCAKDSIYIISFNQGKASTRPEIFPHLSK